MKTRFLKLSCFALVFFTFFGCNDCSECEKEITDEQKKEVTIEIENGVSAQFEAFKEIKLPVFLGVETNNVPQHLHIEGGILNPFFIAGSFTSEKKSKNICTITNLKFEVIPSVTGNGPVNYKFDGEPKIESDSSGGLKINITVVEDTKPLERGDDPNNISVSLPTPIDVNYNKIIDMTVKYSGSKKEVYIYEEVEFCCPPVICKSIIYF